MKPNSVFISLISLLIAIVLNSPLSAQKATAEFITRVTPPAFGDSISVQDGDRYVSYYQGYLYVVNQWIGVQVVDVSDIHAPKKVAFIHTRDMAHHITFAGNNAYISSEGQGVSVYDISNPVHPTFLSKIKTPGDAYWASVQGPYLYVALGNDGFCVMDISDLNNVRTLTLEPLGAWVASLEARDSHLFVAAKRQGILIYDTTNPANLKKLTQFKTGFLAVQMQTEDSLAYIADGPGGLLILDVSHPGIPQQLARFRHSGFSRHVFKSGNYAYLSNREFGLLIVNVADPRHPFLEGTYSPDNETYSSCKQDVYVFLATDTETQILRHNNQPILEPISDITLKEDSSLVLQLQARDPDGDPIMFSARNLPPGALFNDTTGLFRWRPTFEQSGVYPNIIFTVTEQTESHLSDADTLTITVQHVNRPPVLPPIANVEIPEDSQLVIQVPEASDPDREDAGKLTYHVENMPPGASFDPATRVFRWKPTFDQSGTYIMDFVVNDGSGGTDRRTVTLRVDHVDRPPHITPIADQVVDEGQPLTIQLTGNEPDKEDQDKIQFQMENLPPGAHFDPATAVFSWTPNFDQSGVYPNITAIMVAGKLSDTTRFSITVRHVNRPPVLAKISDQTVAENHLLRFTVTGSDPDVQDSGKLVFSASHLPPGAVFDATSREFRWTPSFEQAGVYPGVTFKISDPGGLSDSASIAITVTNVDRPPVLDSIPPLSVDENSELRYQLKASDPDKEDQGKLRFSSPDLPKGAVLNTETGLFVWTPDFDQSGVYRVTFIVTDGTLTDRRQTTITVNNVNRPPVLAAIGNQSVDENQLITFTVRASDADKQDSGKITLSATHLPAGATFNPATGVFSWKPTYKQAGIYPDITFRVTDAEGLFDEKSISITVNNVDLPPMLNPVPPITVDEMQPVSFTLSGTDPDEEDRASLTYSIANLPQGATLDAKTGQFNWTPSYDQAGVYHLRARVIDPDSLFGETTVQITVKNVNRPPVVVPLPLVIGKENQPLSIALRFSDPDKEDAGKLTITATDLPQGATLDAKTGTIHWTPNYEQAGQYTIHYQVTDSQGASAEGRVSLTIENVNRPPVAPRVPDVTATENELLTIVLPEADDPDKEDAGKLIYRLENLPQGATFDPATRTLKWIPNYQQAGEYTLTYIVTDPAGAEASTTFRITVKNADRPPVLEKIGDKTVKEGSELQFKVTASDPDKEDEGKLKLSVSGLPDGARFDADNGRFSWTPAPGQAGEYQVTFKVTDAAGQTAAESVKIKVESASPPQAK